jgi:hypothetical protein
MLEKTPITYTPFVLKYKVFKKANTTLKYKICSISTRNQNRITCLRFTALLSAPVYRPVAAFEFPPQNLTPSPTCLDLPASFSNPFPPSSYRLRSRPERPDPARFRFGRRDSDLGGVVSVIRRNSRAMAVAAPDPVVTTSTCAHW